jgi:hypothetical protein
MLAVAGNPSPWLKKEGQTFKACWKEAAISENKSSDIDNRSAAKDWKVDSNFCKGL